MLLSYGKFLFQKQRKKITISGRDCMKDKRRIKMITGHKEKKENNKCEREIKGKTDRQ